MSLDIPALIAGLQNATGAKPTLTLPSPLSPALANALGGKTLTLQIVSGNGNLTTFKLPDGTTFNARLTPPLTPGSTLQLTVPNLLPGSGNAASTNAPQNLPIRVLSTPAPTPQQPATQTTPQAPLPPVTLTQPAPTPTNIQSPNQPTLPPGPILLTLPNSQQTLTPGQPVTLTITQPPGTNGTQTATLSTALPNQPAITLTAGAPLPVGTQITVTPVTPQPTVATTQTTAPTFTSTPTQQPALLSTPVTLPTTGTAPEDLTTPPELSTLRILFGNTPNAAPQPQTNLTLPQPARVLAAPAPQPAAPTSSQPQPFIQQPVLLANGQQLTVESPQGLQPGTLLMLTLNPTPTVTSLQTVNPQPQQVPLANPATTQTTAPQSVTPLPPGTVVQGEIIENPQNPSQPLLQISTPGPWQNQTLPLSASPAQTQQLPIGTQVSLRLDANGQATLLAAQIPADLARTQTLATTFTTLGDRWSALQQLVETLPTLLPALSQQLSAKLPQLAAFLPSFASYADAVQRNSAQATFGPDVLAFAHALGLNLSDDVQLLHQLQQPQTTQPQTADARTTTAQQTQQAQQQTDTTWRGLLFPYQENPHAQPRQGGFFWRRQKQAEEDEKTAPASTRFVVELSLSNLGDIQLDGLLHYPALWLRLRLKNRPADAGFTASLQTLVNATLSGLKLEGGLAVEQTSQFPVDPRAEMLTATPVRGQLV